jgi:hypothetical protein
VDFLSADLRTLGVLTASGAGDSDPFRSMFVVTGEKDTLRDSLLLGIDSHKLREFWRIC